jgi:hypothetical protein
MNHRLLERACSLGLALLVTLAVLGSIDLLAQPDAAGALWAALDAMNPLRG